MEAREDAALIALAVPGVKLEDRIYCSSSPQADKKNIVFENKPLTHAQLSSFVLYPINDHFRQIEAVGNAIIHRNSAIGISREVEILMLG